MTVPRCGQKPHAVSLCLGAWGGVQPMGASLPGFSILRASAAAKPEGTISSDRETSEADSPACEDAAGRSPSTPALTQPSRIQPAATWSPEHWQSPADLLWFTSTQISISELISSTGKNDLCGVAGFMYSLLCFSPQRS